MSEMLESKLQGIIIADIKARGVKVVFKVEPVDYKGVQDVFFMAKNVGVHFIEFKRTNGIATPLQMKRKRDAEEAGAKCWVCYGMPDWLLIRQQIWKSDHC